MDELCWVPIGGDVGASRVDKLWPMGQVNEDGTVESGKIVDGHQTHEDGPVESGKICPGSVFQVLRESPTTRLTGSQASGQK